MASAGGDSQALPASLGSLPSISSGHGTGHRGRGPRLLLHHETVPSGEVLLLHAKQASMLFPQKQHIAGA